MRRLSVWPIRGEVIEKKRADQGEMNTKIAFDH